MSAADLLWNYLVCTDVFVHVVRLHNINQIWFANYFKFLFVFCFQSGFIYFSLSLSFIIRFSFLRSDSRKYWSECLLLQIFAILLHEASSKWPVSKVSYFIRMYAWGCKQLSVFVLPQIGFQLLSDVIVCKSSGPDHNISLAIFFFGVR